LILPGASTILWGRWLPSCKDAHPEPFFRSSVGEKMVCILFAWKDGGSLREQVVRKANGRVVSGL
jgi:hypothetical protein